MKLEAKKLKANCLNEVTFSIPECKTIAILGPTGSGKSTLLRLIAGLEKPDSGSLIVNDNELHAYLEKHQRDIGIVFQSDNLFPHLTVLENIRLPLCQVYNLSPGEATGRALHFLTRYHLEGLANKKPRELTKNEKQRIAIIRAIALHVRFLLLDEPAAGLDPLMTSEVLDLIFTLKNSDLDIILVSHHMGFVKKFADWILFLDQGNVIECCPKETFYTSPQTTQGKLFLEKVLRY